MLHVVKSNAHETCRTTKDNKKRNSNAQNVRSHIISKLKKKEITCSSDLFGLDCAHGGDILAIRCKCYQSCQGRRRSDEEYKHGDLPTTFVAEKPTRSAISTTKLKNTVKT